MATIPNSTTVSAPIAPSDTGDQYPTHFAKYGNGGLVAVEDVTAREGIPALRREEGMWVQQLDDGSIWRLLGGIANGNWEEVKMTMDNIVGLIYALSEKEDSLGLPPGLGYTITSDELGVRSWVALAGLDLTPFITKALETSGSVISFAVPQIYNSVASPSISNITNDLTDAVIGIVQKIYHNHSVAPTFPAGWVKIGTGDYIVNTLNIIYCEWVSGTRVEYWITQ